MRLGEKEALDSLLRVVEQREALLPTLEYYQERRLKRLGLMDDSEWGEGGEGGCGPEGGVAAHTLELVLPTRRVEAQEAGAHGRQ